LREFTGPHGRVDGFRLRVVAEETWGGFVDDLVAMPLRWEMVRRRGGEEASAEPVRS